MEPLKRVMRAAERQRLADVAVRRGDLSAEDAAAALAEAETRDLSLGEVLLSGGRLSKQAITAIEEQLAEEDFVRPAASSVSTPPDEVRAVTDDPARHLGGHVLVDRVGEGGASEVWRAWDPRLGRWVAIKIARGIAQSRSAAERFRREGTAVARLDHRHIIPIFQVGEEGGRTFTVMPLVAGRPLSEVALPWRQAVALMIDVADAIHHAHQQGVVHRDLKPHNILLDGAGHAWVHDFGLVALADAGARLTLPGDVLGTAPYMSPEQASGAPGAAAPATDVYGLGVTLYELCSGQPAFSGDSLGEIVNKVITQDPPAPRALRPEIPVDLETIILRAMDKVPTRRYASAAQLADDLRRLLAEQPIVTRRPGPALRFGRYLRRHVLAYTGAALGAAAVGAGAVSRSSSRAGRNPVAESRAMQDVLRELRGRRPGDADLAHGLPAAGPRWPAFLDLVGTGATYRGRHATSSLVEAHRFVAEDGSEVTLVWAELWRAVDVSVPHEAFDGAGRARSVAPRYDLTQAPLFLRGKIALVEGPPPAFADASLDFTPRQNEHGWSYLAELPGGSMVPLQFVATSLGGRWERRGDLHMSIDARGQHPGAGAAVRRYTITQAGTAAVRGFFQHMAADGDGTVNVVRHNGQILWERTLRNARADFDLSFAVATGDTIDFVTRVGGDRQFDATQLRATLLRLR